MIQLWKTIWQFLKNLNRELPYDSANSFLGIYLKELKTYVQRRLGGSVKYPTLDFSSGHDPMVREIEPHIRLCTDNTKPAWDSLSLSTPPLLACVHDLSLSLSLSLIFSQKINK